MPVGSLLVIAPAGDGARELALIVLLGTGAGAVASRLLFTVGAGLDATTTRTEPWLVGR